MNKRILAGVALTVAASAVLVLWPFNAERRFPVSAERPHDSAVSASPVAELRKLREENAVLKEEVATLRTQLENVATHEGDTIKQPVTAAMPAPEAAGQKAETGSPVHRVIPASFVSEFLTWTPEAWERVGNELVGTGIGPKEKPFLTYSTYYSSIDRVVVRGRIVPPSTENFRMSVGAVNLIFNWEMGDENHYRNGKEVTRTPGHALTPGQNHTIEVSQQEQDAVVMVDGQEVYRTEVDLEGTVTVCPAHGSTIAFSTIEIDGVPEPDKTVEHHSHSNTY